MEVHVAGSDDEATVVQNLGSAAASQPGNLGYLTLVDAGAAKDQFLVRRANTKIACE